MSAKRKRSRHSNDGTSADPADQLEILRARDYPARPVRWLWPGRIPIGKVTLLVGDPGAGKSLVALDIAARVSRAAAWPDQCSRHTPCAVTDPDTGQSDREKGRQGDTPSSYSVSPSPPLPVSPSSVLLLSAEDDLADTIRPRLDAAGADCDRVFLLPSIADLRHDFAKLRAAVDHTPNCHLIVIDPINAYVGPTDSHFHSVVRKVLAPLAQLAKEKRIAVLAIAHLRKNEGAAIYRAAGSMGFVAAARAVWTVCRDHAHPGRHLFLPLKNNLTATVCGLAYTIQPHHSSGAAAVAWNSAPITTPAEQALARAHGPRGPEAVELIAAGEWLQQALARGPRSASQLTDEAAQRGFQARTLRRALHAIGGQTENRGPLDGWWWQISNATEDDNPGDTEKLVPFQKTCPLSGINSAPPTPSAPTPSNPQSEIRIPKSPSVSESIAALNRLERQRRDDRRHKTTREPQPPPTKTGNPLLDDILDAFRNPPPINPPNSHPTPFDTS